MGYQQMLQRLCLIWTPWTILGLCDFPHPLHTGEDQSHIVARRRMLVPRLPPFLRVEGGQSRSTTTYQRMSHLHIRDNLLGTTTTWATTRTRWEMASVSTSSKILSCSRTACTLRRRRIFLETQQMDINKRDSLEHNTRTTRSRTMCNFNRSLVHRDIRILCNHRFRNSQSTHFRVAMRTTVVDRIQTVLAPILLPGREEGTTLDISTPIRACSQQELELPAAARSGWIPAAAPQNPSHTNLTCTGQELGCLICDANDQCPHAPCRGSGELVREHAFAPLEKTHNSRCLRLGWGKSLTFRTSSKTHMQ